MSAIGMNASLLSNDVKMSWLHEDKPRRIQLASIFPFLPVAGDALCYATTDSLQPAVSIDFEDSIVEDTKSPKDPGKVFGFAEIATQFRVSYKAQDIFSSNSNDQVEVQMALATRELLYRFWIMFESGDSSRPGEFDGLEKLVDPCQVIDNHHQPLTLERLEQAKELVRSNDGRGVVIFTDSPGKRAINSAHWNRGLSPEYQPLEMPCPRETEDFERVLSFDGAPVYINDLNGYTGEHVKKSGQKNSAESTSSNIWFFVMGENNLHGITPAALESGLFVTRSTLLPDGSTTVYHQTMPVGIALGSSSSLAVIKNVNLGDTLSSARSTRS